MKWQILELPAVGLHRCPEDVMWDAKKRQPVTNSLLDTSGKDVRVSQEERNLDPCPGLFFSMSLSQMATYYLAANPTQSFQSLICMKHTGTISRFCILIS